jgi:carbamoyltransferase
MKIVGVNFGHDSAITYLENGVVKFAVEEEKTSRKKQDIGWARTAWSYLSRSLGISAEQIDVIAVGGRIYSAIGSNEIRYRFSKNRRHRKLEILARIASYAKITKNSIGEPNKSVFEEQFRKMGFINAKVVFEEHHLCHAASAFYCAPFTPDLVVTCDGYGDEDSFSFFVQDESGSLKRIHRNRYDTSIGQFYSCVTHLLGFRAMRHEGKITGLAAFGKKGPLVEKFSNLFFYEGDHLRRFPYGQVDEMKSKYEIEKSISLRDKINLRSSESDVGYSYGINTRILLAWLNEVTKGHSKEDIAYACQYVTEEVILQECDRVYRRHFSGRSFGLGLAGGVFANVRVNQKIYELPWVQNVFVQPAMGDSGLALGAAILADISEAGRLPSSRDYQLKHTYYGPNYDVELDGFLHSIDRSKFSCERMKNPPLQVAQLLAEDGIIGLWQGPMEWGPRALGHRSIILNTFNRDVNQSLNERLERTEFMPFAPSVIDRKATEYFPEYNSNVPAGDYMTITYDVKMEHRDRLQAVTHVDGTARPHIVKREVNPFFYDIINEFEKLTGCGAIVNTSFNAHEEPIVSGPAVALEALASNRVDVLVLKDHLVRRRQPN